MLGDDDANQAGPTQGLGYKDMKDCYYYPATILLFVMQAVIAILTSNVAIVFDFLSAVCVSCLGFLFPSIFYLAAEKYFCKNE